MEVVVDLWRGGGGGSVGDGRGRLDALDESGHPEVPHRVLELLAVYVAFELLRVLLDPRSPGVLRPRTADGQFESEIVI